MEESSLKRSCEYSEQQSQKIDNVSLSAWGNCKVLKLCKRIANLLTDSDLIFSFLMTQASENSCEICHVQCEEPI